MTKKKAPKVHLFPLPEPGQPFGPTFGFMAWINSSEMVRPKQLPMSQRVIKPNF